jgi:hypothetical protein
MITTLNPIPALLATLIHEQGVPKDQICIHPDGGLPRASMREVLDVQKNRKTGVTSIVINSKSDQRLNLERTMDENSPLLKLCSVFERETTRFQIEQMYNERRHILGLSSTQASFFSETAEWDEEHQKILSFLLPYRSQIKADLKLGSKCLAAALKVPVRMEMKASEKIQIAGTVVEKSIVNMVSLVGGSLISQRPKVGVKVGIVPIQFLREFAESGRQREFLEKGLLPNLLPETWDWEIEIEVQPEYSIFRVSDKEIPLCTGINTIIT